nr:FHA domain-containing protein At4g14490-like [Ipomoea batatas]
MTRSSSKAENFDGGASQVETDDIEIVENSSAIETAAQYADENASDEAKKGHQKQKQINLQAESVTTEEEEGAAKMSISKEHAQCKVEAIRSMEEERQVEGYNAVEELVNLREEGNNGVLNTSGANKDKNGVLERAKCQDESIQHMVEDGQVEGNHTMEEQLTFEEEARHGLPNVSGGNMGKPDVEEVNLEILTLGEWLDYLEIYVPKQIIDVTEEMILEMRKKAEKLQEFMLHQKNAKENT